MSTAAITACNAGSEYTHTRPQIQTASRVTPAVGEEVRFNGTGLAPASDGVVDLRFVGRFQPAGGGTAQPVDLTVTLARDVDGSLVWRRFGAFRVPFGSGDRIGQFLGTVSPTNRYLDGTFEPADVVAGTPLALTVEPSLVVSDFRAEGQTWVAGCRTPTTTALNGLTYGMRVRAVGFRPVEMQFTVTSGLVQRDAQNRFAVMPGAVRLPPVRNVTEHALLMEFAPVPANTDGYRTSVVVRATGADGIVRELEYPITVRQPMQVYFPEAMQLAQTYPPEMVSGCIPGGGGGVMVEYAEQRIETRSRTIADTVEHGWETSYGTQHAETWGTSASMGGSASQTHMVTMTDARTVGGSQSSTTGFSSTQGRASVQRLDFNRSGSQAFGWSVNNEQNHSFNRQVGANAEVGLEVGVEASGSAGIPLVAEGSVGGHVTGHVNVGIDGRLGWTDGSSDSAGRNGTQTSTAGVSGGTENSTNSSQTSSRSNTQSRHWDRTQSYSEANSVTNERNWQNTRSYSDARTQSRSISQRLGTSTTDSTTVSSSQARSLQISGAIPTQQFGVWYRQTSRMVRRGVVIAYDLCGNGSQVGTVMVDDWTWAPNLATGPTCPPPANFPAASCRVPPCR